jgi:hypothetical protein
MHFSFIFRLRHSIAFPSTLHTLLQSNHTIFEKKSAFLVAGEAQITQLRLFVQSGHMRQISQRLGPIRTKKENFGQKTSGQNGRKIDFWANGLSRYIPGACGWMAGVSKGATLGSV